MMQPWSKFDPTLLTINLQILNLRLFLVTFLVVCKWSEFWIEEIKSWNLVELDFLSLIFISPLGLKMISNYSLPSQSKPDTSQELTKCSMHHKENQFVLVCSSKWKVWRQDKKMCYYCLFVCLWLRLFFCYF